MKKVVILYKFLPQYRVDFFNQLKEKLQEHNIELVLVYGKMKDASSKKGDEVDLPWAIYRENRQVVFNKLLWQPALDVVKGCDLIIVEHANKLLINYLLMPMRVVTKTKLAFWGHGRNMQEDPGSIKNRIKYAYIGLCDHWFAYTNGVKSFLLSKHVPEKSITVVNNAIDTKVLRDQYLRCSDDAIIDIKNELGIQGSNIAVYSGAIYDIKRIDFLIEAGYKIREKIDDFHLVVIGAGPDEHKVKAASDKYSWLHYVGPKFGEDRIVYFKMSSLLLLPGAVGLAILDSFATETPMVTTDNPLHGPEIEYLESGKNGLMTNNSLEEYSEGVINLLENTNRITELKNGCLLSSEQYTTEKMVDRFSEGVLRCLES